MPIVGVTIAIQQSMAQGDDNTSVLLTPLYRALCRHKQGRVALLLL